MGVITASFKIEVLKVQYFGIFDLPPIQMSIYRAQYRGKSEIVARVNIMWNQDLRFIKT